MTFLNRFRRLARERKQQDKLRAIGIKMPPAKAKKECKWPIGDVGKPGFHFCCKEAIEGRSPYCQEHTSIAYYRAPQKQKPEHKALKKVLGL